MFIYKTLSRVEVGNALRHPVCDYAALNAALHNNRKKKKKTSSSLFGFIILVIDRRVIGPGRAEVAAVVVSS